MKKLKLRAARLQAGLEADFVAKQCGISVSTLYSYERYETTPPINVGMKLAQLYGLTVDEIDFGIPFSSE